MESVSTSTVVVVPVTVKSPLTSTLPPTFKAPPIPTPPVTTNAPFAELVDAVLLVISA